MTDNADLLELARALARVKHAGQVRTNGEPYFAHVERVAERVADLGHEYQFVAYLHDLVEDTDVSLTDIRDLFGGSMKMGSAYTNVWALTHRPGETYNEYIHRLATFGTDVAIQVKLADLADNLVDPPGDLRARYIRADVLLRAKLRDRGVIPWDGLEYPAPPLETFRARETARQNAESWSKE